MMCKHCSLKCIASDCDCICHNKLWSQRDVDRMLFELLCEYTPKSNGSQIIHDGESTFVEICNYLEQKKMLKHVNHYVYDIIEEIE